MLGVLNDVPDPTEVPPVDATYQLIVPAEVVAPRFKMPGPQLESGVVEVMLGIVFTVAKTGVLVPETQPFTSVASV